MPTRSSERWIGDGDNVKKQLEALGYKVDLQYAEDDIPTQTQQLDNQITKGAKLLIIASIDGTAITTQLENAKANKIPVIAYDRLIRNSPNVDYYATFDNFKVGVQQATSLLTGLKVLNADGSKGTAKGPFNIELFAGSPDDNNATFFFNGAMTRAQAVPRRRHPGRQEQADRLQDGRHPALAAEDRPGADGEPADLDLPGGAKVDGVLSPYDGLSIGILSALKSNGYGTAGAAVPDRHRPGRRAGVGQVDHRG